uniref:GFO/IDH/MocA-like oxidoreductase domain-containing protein n=1 Tax=Chelydra serpentina TaxID=8475 RepID=A0A8C3S2J0_CHESE
QAISCQETGCRPQDPLPCAPLPPQAYWTRFFPASERLHALLSQRALGELKVVRADFGAPVSGFPRMVQKELGAGALLDIGCYCVHFATMVFGDERPESIVASGFLQPTGVDETLSVILNYGGKRQAVITCSMMTWLPNQAAISGTEGIIQLPSQMWSPTELVVKGQREEFPLPTPSQPTNFPRSTGLRYEAQHVRQCLLKGNGGRGGGHCRGEGRNATGTGFPSPWIASSGKTREAQYPNGLKDYRMAPPMAQINILPTRQVHSWRFTAKKQRVTIAIVSKFTLAFLWARIGIHLCHNT